jgi:hypothetical protein
LFYRPSAHDDAMRPHVTHPLDKIEHVVAATAVVAVVVRIPPSAREQQAARVPRRARVERGVERGLFVARNFQRQLDRAVHRLARHQRTHQQRDLARAVELTEQHEAMTGCMDMDRVHRCVDAVIARMGVQRRACQRGGDQ